MPPLRGKRAERSEPKTKTDIYGERPHLELDSDGYALDSMFLGRYHRRTAHAVGGNDDTIAARVGTLGPHTSGH
jgi:hypothetical protein